MMSAEIVEKGLDSVYMEIRDNKEKSSRIQNWCITVWLAALVGSKSTTISLTAQQALLLPLLPIALFWLLDGMQHAFLTLHFRRASRLEQGLLSGAYDELEPGDCFLFLGTHWTTSFQKLRFLLQALFLFETVVVFYALLLAATLVFVLVLQ